MPLDNLTEVLEALIFAADEPLSEKRLQAFLSEDEVSVGEIRKGLETLRERCDGRAYELVEVAGGFRFMTRPDFARWVTRYKTKRAENRLSRPALETLAIVAYKQPIVRSEIDSIRGVGTGPALRTLMDRGLIKIVGRSEEIGRPVLYGTTDRFLEFFGIRTLEDLPKQDEM